MNTLHRFLGSIVVGWMLQSLAAAQPAAVDPPEMPTARMDLSAMGRNEGTILIIRITNTEEEPILVDRKLIFGLSIAVAKPRVDGRAFWPEEIENEPIITDPPNKESRFVELKPQQSIVRKVAIFKGFYDFGGYGYGFSSEGNVSIPGYETKVRIPTDEIDSRDRIVVSHGGGRDIFFVHEVKKYIGADLSQMKLYRQSLSGAVALPWSDEGDEP